MVNRGSLFIRKKPCFYWKFYLDLQDFFCRLAWFKEVLSTKLFKFEEGNVSK